MKTNVPLHPARATVFLLCLALIAPAFAQQPARPDTFRPVVRGTRAIVAGGQPLVVEAGLRILHKGGNAVDAGVAATFAGSVIEISHFAFGGEVPVIIRLAGKPVVTINGQGPAPKLATREFFEKRATGGGQEGASGRSGASAGLIPSAGPLAACVPGVLDAMIVALDQYGTMRLADVLQPAIELADGFPIDELRVNYIRNTRPVYEPWADSRAVFLPGGEVPKVGDIFAQKNLARTLRELVDVEKKNARRGRSAALNAVRDHFYRGPVAQRIGAAMEKMGGLLRAGDLAAFRAEVAEPVKVSYHGYDVYKVGFGTQGPVMLQTLNLLDGFDLGKMGHNSADYIHTVIEALKLSFADRDRHYGDQRFVKVPAAELLSPEYTAMRRRLIDPKTASLDQRPGDPAGGKAISQMIGMADETGASDVPEAARAHDTTCVNVIDAQGNVFSATPSGAWLPAVVAGDTGVLISSRLQSFLLKPGHPNELQPGKRPRMTLSPTLVMKDGQPFAALSTPGGDNQDQALLQTLLNIIEFGMNPQEAVEAPRFETRHLVSSFDDHKFNPGLMLIENRIDAKVGEDLKARGHKLETAGPFANGSAPTIILYDPKTKALHAGADVRRGRYVIGW
ncbi:MAG: gamma-glutamyltransferase family protein [Blastocatellia bacterium]